MKVQKVSTLRESPKGFNIGWKSKRLQHWMKVQKVATLDESTKGFNIG